MGTRVLVTRVRALDLRKIDAVAAVLLTVGGLVETRVHGGVHPDAFEYILSVAATGGVAWRRSNPVVVCVVAVGAMAGFQAVGGPLAHLAFQPVAAVLDFYWLGRIATSRAALGQAVPILAWGLAGAVAMSDLAHNLTVETVIEGWISLLLSFAAGYALSCRQALVRDLRSATVELERGQEAIARHAADEERERIAREIHDVIAHDVSVMVIQTSAARRVAPVNREMARAALEVVEQCGDEVLVELRRVMGIVHLEEDETGTTPGLADLPALVARTRAAGLPVELRFDEPCPEMSPGVELVAYRVVQEALTNALKHAGSACSLVRLGVAGGALVVHVSDTGRGSVADITDDDKRGHGLIGMRQRVELYGGDLRINPGRSGGFEVRARIPIEDQHS